MSPVFELGMFRQKRSFCVNMMNNLPAHGSGGGHRYAGGVVGREEGGKIDGKDVGGREGLRDTKSGEMGEPKTGKKFDHETNYVNGLTV